MRIMTGTVLLLVVLAISVFPQAKPDQESVAATVKQINTGGIHVLPIPFEIKIDPMERLLLINIDNDPDSVYLGFEPQVFDDDIHGTGHIVIGWRVDGWVDVFHEPGLTLDPDGYDITGKGLAHMVERDMADCFFYVDEAGVQAYYSFEDLEGRTIELKVHEYSSRKRQPFGLLAPMGEAAADPSALPLILLHDFYFVRRKDTDISVTIDGRSHELDKLPLPLNWSLMYFTRYSPDPLIVTLNPVFEGTLPVLEVTNETVVTNGDTTYEIAFDKGTPVLKSIQRHHKEHVVSISFEPAFPNLSAFAEKASVKGSFAFSGHHSTGKVEGHYTVEHIDNEIQVVLVPSKGWIPQPTSLSLRFLYTVARTFKNWPKSYQWTASVVDAEESGLHMSSSWERLW